MTPSAAKAVGYLAGLLLAGCGANWRALSAPTYDYADYRQVHVAPALGARLSAAARYLERHPQGDFRDEVRTWFDQVEPLFYEALADSANGMQAYLDALPRGPHAASAEQRRDALRAQARAEAGERLSALGAELERKLAAAAQSREEVVTAYVTWLGRVIDFDAWGRPLGEAKAEFASAWLAEPKPKCSAARCVKVVSLRYELEISGKHEPFVCLIEVSFGLTNGRVTDARIAGPDLFSRLAEAHQAEPVAADAAARTQAFSWVVEVTSGAVERRLERGRCAKEATPPALMVRECGGFKLELVPRTAADEEDRVVIRGPSGL